MLGTGLPSFKGEPTIRRLRDRFALGISERQAADFMLAVVKNAHENVRSTVYDEFQRHLGLRRGSRRSSGLEKQLAPEQELLRRTRYTTPRPIPGFHTQASRRPLAVADELLQFHRGHVVSRRLQVPVV